MEGIRLDVINNGRDYGAVLQAYMKAFDDAKAVSVSMGKSDDEAISDAMAGAAYRIYLLGVEDGMKAEGKQCSTKRG